jgi:uncharacterized membrane protein YgdD (TMEM256/DUF423 family)
MRKHTLYLLFSGCLLMALGIALGAFGAHGVENNVDPYFFKVYQTASRFHLYEACGLILLALVEHHVGFTSFRLIRNLQYAGVLVFCGTLYLLGTSPLWTTANMKWLGAITPLGGICLIAGWTVAAFQLFKQAKKSQP